MAKIEKTETLHEGWGSFHLVTVRENGELRYRRQVEDHGDAVGVLPYDSDRGVVILVRQLRIGPLFGGRQAHVLEIPAGLIEKDEDPEVAARREVLEETGLELRGVEALGSFWASPGVSTELMHLYLATYTPDDRVTDGGGAEDEHENIEVIELPLANAKAMIADGRINDMKTFAALQALFLRSNSVQSTDAK